MSIAAHDFVLDSPTNTFATLANTLQHDATSSAVSDGNLKYLEPSNSLAHSAMSNAIANFSNVLLLICMRCLLILYI